MNLERATRRPTVRIGHSPDPDDAFMYYGLASGRVPTGPYEVEQVLQDIESLNRLALEGSIEVTAVSIHAYAYLADRYLLLPCGASMGDGYGPIVVTRGPAPADDRRPGAPARPRGRAHRGPAVRSHPARRLGRRGGGRPADPRGAADVRAIRRAQGARPG